MNLSLNVRYLTQLMDTQSIAKLVSSAGFDSADYNFEHMVDRDDPLNSKDGLRIAEQIGKQMADNGLPVRQTHAPFKFRNFSDPVEFEEFIRPAVIRSIEYSAAMGAKVVVVHPLHHMVYAGHEEEIFQRNMEYYRSMIPVCKDCGIKVGVENMFQRDSRRGHIVHDTCSRAEEFCRYIDTLDSEYMVACLDVGHVGLPAQADEVWDVIRKLGHDRLQALHIHDNDYKDDRHGVPYTGKIDWNKVTQALGEIDYSGDFTYEVFIERFTGGMERELLPDALCYLAKVGRHLVDLVDRNRPESR